MNDFLTMNTSKVFEEEKDEKDAKEDNQLRKLGKEIADVRKVLGCTQSMFAQALEITPQTLSLIERGNFKLTNNLAAKIYFSLYELVKDREMMDLLGIPDYINAMIETLMDELREYISQLNSNLVKTINNK